MAAPTPLPKPSLDVLIQREEASGLLSSVSLESKASLSSSSSGSSSDVQSSKIPPPKPARGVGSGGASTTASTGTTAASAPAKPAAAAGVVRGASIAARIAAVTASAAAPVQTASATAPPRRPLPRQTSQTTNPSSPAAAEQAVPPSRKPPPIEPTATTAAAATTPLSPRGVTPLSPRVAGPVTPLSPRGATPLSPRAAGPVTPLSPRAAGPATPLSPRGAQSPRTSDTDDSSTTTSPRELSSPRTPSSAALDDSSGASSSAVATKQRSPALEDANTDENRMRAAVINEIISTEEAYIDDVAIIIRKFVVPLRMSSFISMQELGQLFSNIDLLMSANQSMLKQMLPLRNVPAIDAMIGNIFSAEVEYLIQAYTHYCLNQTTATATYSNLMKKSKFRSFVEKMWTDPECRGLDMLAFIVKPVQRICKYPLLLRELLKYTPENHSDYENLQMALEKMNSVVALVNQSSREAGNLQQILDVEESLVNAKHVKLVIPGRRFVKGGKLTKISGSNVQERQFFLFNDLLLYAKPVLMKTKTYEFRGLIPLMLCSIKDLPDTDGVKNAIEIWRIDLKKKYIVYSDEPETKAEWLSELEACIAEAQTLQASQEAEEDTGDVFESTNVAFQMGKDDTKSEQSLKMAELETRIVGFKAIAKAGRLFLKEGAVMCTTKPNSFDMKPRHFFMFNDMLLITKRHTDKAKKSFHMKGEIPLSMVLVSGKIGDAPRPLGAPPIAEIEHGFEIVRIDTKTKTIVSVANEEVKMEWVEALTGVMKMGVLRPELDPSATSMSSPQRAARPDKACPNCHQAYGISRAKKRCAICNNHYCAACCSKKRIVASKGLKPVKLCDRCFFTS